MPATRNACKLRKIRNAVLFLCLDSFLRLQPSMDGCFSSCLAKGERRSGAWSERRSRKTRFPVNVVSARVRNVSAKRVAVCTPVRHLFFIPAIPLNFSWRNSHCSCRLTFRSVFYFIKVASNVRCNLEEDEEDGVENQRYLFIRGIFKCFRKFY